MRGLLRRLDELGYDTGGPGLQRVPRGFDPGHRHADLLRRDEVHGMTTLIHLPMVTSAKLVEVCLQFCSDLAPLNRWLRDRLAGPPQA